MTIIKKTANILPTLSVQSPILEVAVAIKNLNKTFNVREKAAMTIRTRALAYLRGQRITQKRVHALQNLNLTIDKGEFFGIIGRNGSGKSTLLHLLMGAMKPDKGSVIETKGKLLRLAQGMNFEPELTARDNIYLMASILGLTFKKIGSIFHEIIAFAEIENFVDIPVKTYSNGMLSKLKFAIATYAEADILLMDEFFVGVGDLNFKEKSEKVFRERLVKGRTIIHVSHSLESIVKHCDRVLLLDRGVPLAIGKPEEIVAQYEALMQA
ncbi:MAG: ATP-binding cassette domain-containing protein [Bacteroidota bacterium]